MCPRDRESGLSMHWGSSIQRCTQKGASERGGGQLRRPTEEAAPPRLRLRPQLTCTAPCTLTM